MDRFFNPDNIMNKILGRIFDLMVLNAVFLVTCLPIFTIGAALTALYSQTLKMVKHEDAYIVRSYIREFKASFRRSTLLWLPALALLLLFGGDLYVIFNVLDKSYRILQFPVWLLLFAVIAVVLYAFPLTARYEESYKQTIVNSIRLALGNLFVTIFFAVLLIVPADLALHNGHVAVVLFSILIFCGGAALSAFFSLFFMRIFEKAEK